MCRAFECTSVLVISLLFLAGADGRVIHVPGDSATIQGGINGAVDGDTVLVEPGIYVENVTFNVKDIVVGSLFLTTGDTSYISSTIIDGDSSGTVVTVENVDDTTAVITGFTVQNGYAHTGGGIACSNSNLAINHCIITRNSCFEAGGGILCEASNPVIRHCTITRNSLSGFWFGTGIYCSNSSPIISHCTISGNGNPICHGGGVHCFDSSPSLTNVRITRNTAEFGGGI